MKLAGKKPVDESVGVPVHSHATLAEPCEEAYRGKHRSRLDVLARHLEIPTPKQQTLANLCSKVRREPGSPARTHS